MCRFEMPLKNEGHFKTAYLLFLYFEFNTFKIFYKPVFVVNAVKSVGISQMVE